MNPRVSLYDAECSKELHARLGFGAAVAKLLKIAVKKRSDGSPVGAEAATPGPVSAAATRA
jgi:hypothetical protein